MGKGDRRRSRSRSRRGRDKGKGKGKSKGRDKGSRASDGRRVRHSPDRGVRGIQGCGACKQLYICKTMSETGHGYCTNPECHRYKDKKEAAHRDRQERKDRRRQRGQALVEFALVLPLVAFLLVALLDFSRVYTAMMTIEGGTSERRLRRVRQTRPRPRTPGQ